MRPTDWGRHKRLKIRVEATTPARKRITHENGLYRKRTDTIIKKTAQNAVGFIRERKYSPLETLESGDHMFSGFLSLLFVQSVQLSATIGTTASITGTVVYGTFQSLHIVFEFSKTSEQRFGIVCIRRSYVQFHLPQSGYPAGFHFDIGETHLI